MRDPTAEDAADESAQGPEARAFARRLSEAYAPPPLSAAEQARFDAGLEERLERRRRRGGWLPLLAGAASAAALLWVLLPAGAPEPEETPAPRMADATPAAQWEYDLIYSTDAALSGEPEEEEDAFPEAMLPDEYAAIDSLLLGG